jgi:Flp pilus assembly protein TadD
MLTSEFKLFLKNRRHIFLFSIVSLFISFSDVSAADSKQEIAQQYRSQGYQEQQKGNLYEALSYYTKAVSLGMKDPVVLNDIGVIYEHIGLVNKAENFYSQAVVADPSYLPAYSNLGYLYLKTNRRDKAAHHFKKRYELAEAGDPWAEKVKVELLKLRPDLRNWVVAVEARHLEEVVTRKAHDEFYEKLVKADSYFKSGEKHFLAEDYQSAVREFNLALKLTPNNPKIIQMRQKAKLKIMRTQVQEHYDTAMEMLDSGNAYSARNEIQQLLTTIPNEPVINSRQ